MLVGSDSCPLNYLILIDVVQVLPEFFFEVGIPDAVYRELQNPSTPSKVAAWMGQRPAWLRILNPVTSIEGEGLERLGPENARPLLCVCNTAQTPFFSSMKKKGAAKLIAVRSESWAS